MCELMLAATPIPMMHRVVALSLALLVLLVTVEMIRRRRLREEYAMLWLGTSVVLVVIAAFPQLTYAISSAFDISYVTFMVLAVFVFLAMILLHYATVISRQAEQIRQLAEQLAILEQRVRESESGRAADTATDDPASDADSPKP